MLSDGKASYGALEAATVPQEKTVSQRLGAKYVLGFAALALMTVGVVAMSGGVSSSQVDTVVDANRNRATLAKVDPGVRELGLEVRLPEQRG